MVISPDILEKLLPFQCLYEPELELRDLAAAFANTAGRSFLEIGTHKGFTSAWFALAFPGARIVTLDLPNPLHTRWNPLRADSVGAAHRAAGVADRIEQHFMNSAELWRFAGRGERFDLIFIDGDHSEEPVFRDLILCADLLAGEKSAIIVHDYTDESEPNRPNWTFGVQRAVNRFLAVRPFQKRRLAGLLLSLEPHPNSRRRRSREQRPGRAKRKAHPG